jgi:hypothetical protein
MPEAKLIHELQRRLDDIGAPLWRTPEQIEADFIRAAKSPMLASNCPRAKSHSRERGGGHGRKKTAPG